MKVWLFLLLIVSGVGYMGMQERETLGHRIAVNLFELRGQPVAYADTRTMPAEISPLAVVNHIRHLQETMALHCEPGSRLLRAAATTYKPSVVDPQVNAQLTLQVKKLCP